MYSKFKFEMRQLWLVPLAIPIVIGFVAYILYSAAYFGWNFADEVLTRWSEG